MQTRQDVGGDSLCLYKTERGPDRFKMGVLDGGFRAAIHSSGAQSRTIRQKHLYTRT